MSEIAYIETQGGDKVVIRNGFFWAEADGASIEMGSRVNGSIRGCVVCERPRWWQVRRWYRAWRYWLNLGRVSTP